MHQLPPNPFFSSGVHMHSQHTGEQHYKKKDKATKSQGMIAKVSLHSANGGLAILR